MVRQYLEVYQELVHYSVGSLYSRFLLTLSNATK